MDGTVAVGRPESFLDLLAEIARPPVDGDRGEIVARYREWIARNSAASPALYGGYFNLGVELAASGDKAGAVEAYRASLAVRPGFYPAAINLGTLLEAADQPDAALATWQLGLQTAESRAALLACRDRLVEALRVQDVGANLILRLGDIPPPASFRGKAWREIVADADLSSRGLADASLDAVYADHAIERLFAHQVGPAFTDMRRVLKPNGLAFVRVPDLVEVARHVAEGRLEDPLLVSGLGPVAALDILDGHRPSLAADPSHAPPRTGFSDATLAAALIAAGFAAVMLQRQTSTLSLAAVAFRTEPAAERFNAVHALLLSAVDPRAILYRSAA